MTKKTAQSLVELDNKNRGLRNSIKYAILEAFPGFAGQPSLVRTSQGTLRGYLKEVNSQPPVFLAKQPEDPHGQAGDLLVMCLKLGAKYDITKNNATIYNA